MPERKLDDVIAALVKMRDDHGGDVMINTDGEVDDVARENAPKPIPEKVQFDYGLHDGRDHFGRCEVIGERTGIPEDHPVWEKLGRPFYEVTLKCELNTETGQVSILGVSA